MQRGYGVEVLIGVGEAVGPAAPPTVPVGKL